MYVLKGRNNKTYYMNKIKFKKEARLVYNMSKKNQNNIKVQ